MRASLYKGAYDRGKLPAAPHELDHLGVRGNEEAAMLRVGAVEVLVLAILPPYDAPLVVCELDQLLHLQDLLVDVRHEDLLLCDLRGQCRCQSFPSEAFFPLEDND
eukprot:3934686-Rhodomonas_salina.2